MSIFRVDSSAVHFAEGWLAAGHGGRYSAGLNGARYAGYLAWQRPIIAMLIAKDLKRGEDR